MEISDAERLHALETENARLKQIVAEQQLDIAMLKDVASKTGNARRPTGSRGASDDGSPGKPAADVPRSGSRPLEYSLPVAAGAGRARGAVVPWEFAGQACRLARNSTGPANSHLRLIGFDDGAGVSSYVSHQPQILHRSLDLHRGWVDGHDSCAVTADVTHPHPQEVGRCARPTNRARRPGRRPDHQRTRVH